jgi:hypothetical protein
MASKRYASDNANITWNWNAGKGSLKYQNTLVGSKHLRGNDFNRKGMKFVQIQSLSRRSMG